MDEALPGVSPNRRPEPAAWLPVLMYSRWIHANPIPAGVCQVVQEDLALAQIMRHSLIGVKNPQRVTYSREVRSERECHEEFPCRITVSPGCIPLHPLVFYTWPAPSCHSCALGTGEISSLSVGQKAVIRRKNCRLQMSYLIHSILLDPKTASKPLGIVCMEKMLFYIILCFVTDFSML